MKKLICLFLTITVIFALASPAMAATVTTTTEVVYGDTTYTITECGNIRTVTNDSDDTRTTYNMETGELVVEDLSANSTMTINIFDSGIMPAEFTNSSNDNEYAYHQSNRTYNGGVYSFWEIKIPGKVKYTYQTTTNSYALSQFSKNVDSLQQAEDDIIKNFGATILSMALGLVNTTINWINALISVLGASGEIDTLVDGITSIGKYKAACESAFASVVVCSIPN